MLCVILVLGFLTATLVFFTPLRNPKIFPCRHSILGDLLLYSHFHSSCFLRLLMNTEYPELWIHWLLFGGLGHGQLPVHKPFLHHFEGILRRALHVDFCRVFMNIPFQMSDFIILAVYQMVAVNGIMLQI